MLKMKYLFFFVHPSKFHVFRNTINTLKSNGHHVEVVITSKDVLEDLVRSEGWEYTNIFPEGRKMKGVSPYISSAINLVRTIIRLLKYTKGKKYDLFITDDLLVYVGKLRGIKTLVFTDDDLAIVKQFSIILSFADYCLAPTVTDLGKYNKIKIPFNSYKELAYLHPNQFKVDNNVVEKFKGDYNRYFLIRLVSLKSYHDVGKKGIGYDKAKKLIELLEPYGRIYISAERELEKELEKYRIKISPNELKHVLAGADLYVGDSQTMSSEAAVLGVPSFRINDFVGKIGVMEEKDLVYGVSKSYRTEEFDSLLRDLKECLEDKSCKTNNVKRVGNMLKEKIDLTAFMIWLLQEYPRSVEIMKTNPDYQSKFL